jgi:hypothetical protein
MLLVNGNYKGRKEREAWRLVGEERKYLDEIV